MSAQNQPGLSLRRVRRWTLFAFVLVLMLALLSACGAVSAPAAPGAAADADSASSAASAEPTKITYMIWADDIANDKNLNAEIQLFNDSHPDVQVELIGVGWNDYTAKLQTLTAAGTPPDVIAIQNEGDFVSKGFLLPLEDLMSEEGFDPNRFLPGANDPAFDGKIYGLRHDTAFWLLFYNKDYFDQAGVAYPPATGYTIDEFMQTACQLSNGEEMQWGMSNLHWINGILAKQQGLAYVTMDGVDGAPQYRLDDPDTMAWYQKVADFINVENCQPNADQSSSLGGSDAFLAGRTAMAFNGNWGFGDVGAKSTFNWGIAPIPGIAQPNIGMKIGIASGSKNIEAAWVFLKWLTYEPEATRFRAERGMGQPAIIDAEANEIFLNGENAPEGLATILEQLADPANTFPWPGFPGQSQAENIINPAMDQVMQALAQAVDVVPTAVQQANEVLVEEWQRAMENQ